MALGAEMALESVSFPPRADQVVLANLEINDLCDYTKTCGATCYLNTVHVDHPPIDEEHTLSAARAMVLRGDVIRHLAVPGKEAFKSPRLLLQIAHEYHDTPKNSRPASLGVISASSSGLQQWLPQFVDAPLSWLAVSVDVEGSGLRSGNPLRVLEAALVGRRLGATDAVAVNTTFAANTIERVLELGKQLRGKQIDQWALCPLVAPSATGMKSSVSDATVFSLIERLGSARDIAGKIVVETDPLILRRLIGETAWKNLNTKVWRIEVALPNGVWLFARTPLPGYFLRMRFDGALLSRRDFSRIGIEEGQYGRFSEPHDIETALATMAGERLADESQESSPKGVLNASNAELAAA